MHEIIAFIEQRLSALSGQRIRQTIAKVEAGRMSAAASEIAVGLARDQRL